MRKLLNLKQEMSSCLKAAPRLPDYIRELTSFPGCKHDDQVDSTAQALHYAKQFRNLDVWVKLGSGFPRSHNLYLR